LGRVVKCYPLSVEFDGEDSLRLVNITVDMVIPWLGWGDVVEGVWAVRLLWGGIMSGT
jgi:hypothetical protein